MRVRLAGKTWTIRTSTRIKKNFGWCDDVIRLITLRADQTPHQRMDTLVHEVIHAVQPKMRHPEVYKLAASVARVLWKDGWRRTQK